MISVDAKKKELVGTFKNGGCEWQPKGKPEEVKVHDFVDPELGKAIPYGVYDVTNNEGWVSVGIDHDTAQFAVQAIKRWWQTMGRPRYPHAGELLITADGGGSSSNWPTSWGCASMCAISRRAPANGTRSNTGCSRISLRTGAAGP